MTGATGQLSTVSPISRIFGLGSVFAKTVRDSRRSTLIVGVAIGLLLIAVSAGIISQFSTAEAREEIRNIVDAVPPVMQGLAGPPVNVETLGGYIQYKYGGFLPLVTGLWSIIALSATLAGESRRGSLDFLLAEPISRRRVAWEKVLAHVVMLTVAMTLIGAATALAGSFGTLPGDAITVGAAFSFAAWLGLMALAAGSVAFVLAPFFGRGSAAGLAGAVMLGGFLLNGYRTAIPELEPFANLTWFGWTADHIPLAAHVRLGVPRPGRGVLTPAARDRRGGIRAPRPRRRDGHPGATAAASPARPGWPDRTGDERTIPDRPLMGARARAVRPAHRELGRVVHRADR